MIIKKRNKVKGSDEELIVQYLKTRDSYYMGELFRRYKTLCFGVCLKYLKNKELAEDAVINIFEKVLSDVKKSTIKNFNSWIYQVSKNHCLMELRKNKPRKEPEETLSRLEDDSETSLANKKLQEFRIVQIEKALVNISKQQRTCVCLFYINQLTYQEVSEKTGFTLKEVKSYIQNGRRNLKNQLTNANQNQSKTAVNG